MRYYPFSKAYLGTLILAALVVGTWSSPAAFAFPEGGDKTVSTAPKSTSPSAKKTTKSKASSRRKSKKTRGQAAPTPERISEIQEALAGKGVFSGTPTGKWDDSTVQAMKKFQASQGLYPTGKLDALTLQKLGLGSQTAGLAAPVAPPNSTNRLRNTTSSPIQEPRSEEPSN